MKSSTITLAVLCLLAAVATPSEAQKLVVGEEIEASFETQHPYIGSSVAGAPVWTQEIHHPGATYIAPHFSRMDLGPGDYMVVRSPDGSRSWKFDGSGRGALGLGAEAPGFWGIHVKGDRAVIELFGAARGNPWGLSIDKYARGFTAEEMGGGAAEDAESICTVDDKENAICYETSEPDAYSEGRAIARLLISGSSLCTGWLLGDEGHVMTNNHCIGDANDALNTDYEFMAEGATCETDCPQLGCDGTIEHTTANLIQQDFSLDYTLVLPPTNITGTYGFLQLRDTGAVLGERIYSVQHPGGRGKEMAVFSTYPANPSGFAQVDSLTEPFCFGGPNAIGYFKDTEGGSSGSPVLGYADNLVIALHNCRGSGFCTTGDTGIDDPNRGVDVTAIITHLGANLPNNAIGSGDNIFGDGFNNGNTSAWDLTVINEPEP